jgi:DNA polymerase-4
MTPLVEQVSIDEAFLDVSGCGRLHGDIPAMAATLKKRVVEGTGLTCSVGAAPVKFLAKIASDMNKPDGTTLVSPREAPSFAASIPIRRVPGVGESTMKQMDLLGIRLLGDVRGFPWETILKRFGRYGATLWEYAHARDPSAVDPIETRKSVSSEETLDQDTRDITFLKRRLLDQAQRVARDLRLHGLRGDTVFIKVKFVDFTQVTRQAPLRDAECSSVSLYETAAGLLEAIYFQKKARLIGLGVTSLRGVGEPVQMDLFEPRSTGRWETVDRTLDAIRDRFGKDMVRKASLT